MSSVNNNSNGKSYMPEPTLLDLFNMMQNISTKEDINDIKTRIDEYKADTIEKFNQIDQKVNVVSSITNENADNIELLQIKVEELKQDQLKSNICVSGVPTNLIQNDNTADLIIAIAKKLDVDINQNQFTSYSCASNKFIIISFFMLKHKQLLLRKIRVKKSLMVEEVFGVQSNSQIYLNDHLTPYFNHLYLLARRAKKDGKLASASSFNGRIKARKNGNDAPMLITCERQLLSLIDDEMGESSYEQLDEAMDTSQPTTSTAHTTKRQPSNTQRSNRNKKTNKSKTDQSDIERNGRPPKRKASTDDKITPKKTKS